jgi:hypothetical protein
MEIYFADEYRLYSAPATIAACGIFHSYSKQYFYEYPYGNQRNYFLLPKTLAKYDTRRIQLLNVALSKKSLFCYDQTLPGFSTLSIRLCYGIARNPH